MAADYLECTIHFLVSTIRSLTHKLYMQHEHIVYHPQVLRNDYQAEILSALHLRMSF